MCDWFLTDSDCDQYMRHDGDTYEMIESVWLDTTPQDRANGAKEYCVVRASINLSDYSQDEIETYLSIYGYTYGELYKMYSDDEVRLLCAECILEEIALSNTYVIYSANSHQDVQKFIHVCL